MRNLNIKRIHTSKKQIFRFWLELLKPYHKLRNKEIEALSIMLYYRYEISREVINKDLIDNILFSTNTRKQMRADLDNMDAKVFNNLLTDLRRKEVLSKGNIINPVLIPNMSEEGFKLVFNFEIDPKL